MSVSPNISACPACTAAPAAEALANAKATPEANIMLSVPTVHCGACISTVERTLLKQPGVRSARVNLTLKRANVDAEPDTTPDQLIAALNDAGYEAYELDSAALAATQTDEKGRALLMRLAVAGFAMMNVMLLSVAVWSGATEATRDMFHWISAAIALPTIAFSSQPFLASAWSALRVRRLNMDVPISLAILLAAGLSVYETSQGGSHAYFDAALSLTFFLLAGRYLDHRTRSVARSAAQELAALEVPRALLADGTTVPVAELAVDDQVRVVPGARVPADGVVVDGESELDRSLLTGESLPVGVAPSQTVSAGEMNLTGPLLVRVTAAGADSSLHRMAELVAVAETTRNRYTSLADKAAQIYAPLVHVLALAAFVAWVGISGDVRLALNIAVGVLIITCPCALGLAVPAVVTAASGTLFRHGILIKNATALERLAEVDTVVFDKTGTLTTGALRPRNLDAMSKDDLSIARALAQASAHPLAVALDTAIGALDIQPAKLEQCTEVAGHGVTAQANGQTVQLGRADWIGTTPVDHTATYLAIGDKAVQAIEFDDTMRTGAVETVEAMKAKGMDIILLSGDAPTAVADIAERAGIEAWEARLLPQDKVARIAVLSKAGRRVLMVGDGLNDTAALAAAHVSISPATALEAARAVSDMVLLGANLTPVARAIDVARSARRRIQENFAIAAIYNLIAVPIALMGFATPLAAALAMSGSSITVSLNALRLTRK